MSEAEMLSYDPHKINSVFSWSKGIQALANLEDLGEVTRIFKTNEYPKYDEINVTSSLPEVGSIEEIIFKEEIKLDLQNRNFKKIKLENSKPILFYLMMKHLGKTSISQLETSTVQINDVLYGYEEVMTSEDPLILWKFIQETHLSTGSTNKYQRKDNADFISYTAHAE